MAERESVALLTAAGSDGQNTFKDMSAPKQTKHANQKANGLFYIASALDKM